MFSMVFLLDDPSAVTRERFAEFARWMRACGYVSYQSDASFEHALFAQDGQFQGKDYIEESDEASFLALIARGTPRHISINVDHAAGYGGSHIVNKTTDLMREVQAAVERFSEERSISTILDIYCGLCVGCQFCAEVDRFVFAVSLGGDGYSPDWDEFPPYALAHSPRLREFVSEFERAFGGSTSAVIGY